MIGIYKYTNIINGKSYIGQSTDIRKRHKNHRNFAKNNILTAYIDAEIAKYGIENFQFEILEECDKELLDEREQYYIKKYNTIVPFGYNKTEGGRTGSLIAIKSREDVETIRGMLRDTNISEREIGLQFGVTDVTVSEINTGKIWKADGIDYPIRKFQKNHAPPPRYCIYCGSKVSLSTLTGRCWACWQRDNSSRIPTKEVLQESLSRNHSYTKTSNEFGVCRETIRKWCIKYGIQGEYSRVNKDE